MQMAHAPGYVGSPEAKLGGGLIPRECPHFLASEMSGLEDTRGHLSPEAARGRPELPGALCSPRLPAGGGHLTCGLFQNEHSLTAHRVRAVQRNTYSFK